MNRFIVSEEDTSTNGNVFALMDGVAEKPWQVCKYFIIFIYLLRVDYDPLNPVPKEPIHIYNIHFIISNINTQYRVFYFTGLSNNSKSLTVNFENL